MPAENMALVLDGNDYRPAAGRASVESPITETGMRRTLFPVSVFLGTTALLAVAARADDFVPPKAYITNPWGINVADGSFTYSVTDVAIGPLSFERFQVTGPKVGVSRPANPTLGTVFTSNFDIYVNPNPKAAQPTHVPPLPARYNPIVHIGSSASGVYEENLARTSVVANNIDAYAGTLTDNGTNFSYVDRDGTIYNFDATIVPAGLTGFAQRATKVTYGDGRVQSLYYTGSSLKRVDDSSGWALIFDYDGSGNVSAVCGYNTSITYVTNSTTCVGAPVGVSYTHDGSGALTGVTDVLGQLTAYGYTAGAWGVTCVTPPGYSTCKFGIDYHVSGNLSHSVTQTLADGTTWQIFNANNGVNDPDYIPNADGENEGGITDPDGKTTYLTFTNTSPYTMQDANNNLTQYRYWGAQQFDYTGPTYHDGSLLIEVDYPEGGQYLAEHSAPRNAISKETLVAKPGSGLANRVKQYSYSPTGCSAPATNQNCAKPLAVIDARGNETDYTYYDFGGVKTEMQPAPTAGAARPLKTYTYTQLYAYIKNASGTLVPAAAPIWMLTSEVQCQTAAGSSTPTCAGGSGVVRVTTTYQYGTPGVANTLLLRGKVVDSGAVKLNLRTCYGYDNLGNKIWERKPRAGLATCPDA